MDKYTQKTTKTKQNLTLYHVSCYRIDRNNMDKRKNPPPPAQSSTDVLDNSSKTIFYSNKK